MPLFNGGSSGGVGPQKFDASVDEVKEMIQDLDSDVAIVDGKIDDLQTDATEIKTSISEINTNVVEIQQAMPLNIRPSKPILARNQNIALGSKNLTLVDVTGKGILYYAAISNPYGWSDQTNLQIVITIDDKTITCTSTNKSKQYTIGYLANEVVLGTLGDYGLSVEKFLVYIDSDSNCFYLPESSMKIYESPSINEKNTYIYSDYGLRFNQKLKVQVSNNNQYKDMRADASAYYLLDN